MIMRESDLKYLKIGKKYTVRTMESMVRQFGANSDGMPNVLFGFNSEMKKLCGKEVTVVSQFSEKAYRIEEDNKRWSWNSSMFMTPLQKEIQRMIDERKDI